MTVRVVSYGGGVQSNALLVLAAQGKVDFRTFLFANVGEDSEYPGTLTYVREVAMPFAEIHGLDLIELHKLRFKKRETLRERLTRPGSRSIGIPVRMSNGAPGRRQCTADFKIRVCNKWAREHGATEDSPATVALGFSTDEAYRVKEHDEKYPTQRNVHPLIELKLSRQDCSKIIVGAGLPLPPKSACYFCPFHSTHEWLRLAKEEPALFDDACHLEEVAQARRAEIGKDKVFFTRKGAEQKLNLRDLITPMLAQGTLVLEDDEEDGGCDSGSCFT